MLAMPTARHAPGRQPIAHPAIPASTSTWAPACRAEEAASPTSVPSGSYELAHFALATARQTRKAAAVRPSMAFFLEEIDVRRAQIAPAAVRGTVRLATGGQAASAMAQRRSAPRSAQVVSRFLGTAILTRTCSLCQRRRGLQLHFWIHTNGRCVQRHADD